MRLRKKIFGTSERPRLVVHKSLKNIYAQLVDDIAGNTLFSMSTLSLKKKFKYGGNIKAASLLGENLAEEAKKKGFSRVVFDRGKYPYHGKIKALAEAARKGGLLF